MFNFLNCFGLEKGFAAWFLVLYNLLINDRTFNLALAATVAVGCEKSQKKKIFFCMSKSHPFCRYWLCCALVLS